MFDYFKPASQKLCLTVHTVILQSCHFFITNRAPD